MLHIVDDALLLDSLELVIKEHENGAAGRHIHVAGRRSEAWYETEQIRKDDEDGKCSDDAQILMPVVADVAFELLVQEFDKQFKGLLKMSRAFDRKPRT